MVPLEPLTLTVTVDLAEDEGVSVAVFDAQDEPVEGAAEIVGLDRASDDGPLELVVRVNHFSGWVIGKTDGVLRIATEPLADQLVGATFTVRARIARDLSLRDEATYSKRLYVATNDDVTGWDLSGYWQSSGVVSPTRGVNPGEEGSGGSVRPGHYPSGRSAVVAEFEFTCDRAGDFAIGFRASGIVWYTLVSTDPDYRGGGGGSASSPVVSWSAKCIDPAAETPTPTPTSTETPTESPTPVSTATPVPTQTETPPPTETATPAAEPVTVEVLVLSGLFWPADQFRIVGPDACDSDHYHSSGSVFSLDGQSATNPDGCGYGKVSEVEKKIVQLTAEEWQVYLDARAAN